jgi:hypothetical protein
MNRVGASQHVESAGFWRYISKLPEFPAGCLAKWGPGFSTFGGFIL